MLYGMANNNVIIPAERDGALYNFLLGNQDYIFKGVGNEFKITPSSSSFILTLGTGEGVVCGRHVTETAGDTVLQLAQNSSGYVVIRIDLTQVAGSEAYLFATPTLQQENLNDNGTYHDLPLYRYTTNASGVSSFVDVRNISAGSNVVCELNNGQLYVYYYDNGTVTRKQVGSLDPATLTATPADVKAGKTFGGAGSDEVQTGTFAGMTAYVGPSKTARTVSPAAGTYYNAVTVNPVKYVTAQKTVSLPGAGQRKNVTFTFPGISTIFGIKNIRKVSGGDVVTMFSGYPNAYPNPGGINALNIPSTDIPETGNTITQVFFNNSDASNVSAVFEITVAGY